jgi:hypothetical protein
MSRVTLSLYCHTESLLMERDASLLRGRRLDRASVLIETDAMDELEVFPEELDVGYRKRSRSS